MVTLWLTHITQILRCYYISYFYSECEKSSAIVNYQNKLWSNISLTSFLYLMKCSWIHLTKEERVFPPSKSKFYNLCPGRRPEPAIHKHDFQISYVLTLNWVSLSWENNWLLFTPVWALASLQSTMFPVTFCICLCIFLVFPAHSCINI